MCPLFGVRRWLLFGGSKCIGIMGRSNGGSATVRSRGGVRSMEGPSSEVLLYTPFFRTHTPSNWQENIILLISEHIPPLTG